MQVCKSLKDCIEGYSETIGGRTITYARLRNEYSTALLTRATNGLLAIEWKTPPLPHSVSSKEIRVVVLAGMYGQEPTGFRFTLSVNNVERFIFPSTIQNSWAVNGLQGGHLLFHGLMRDQYGDHFGIMEMRLPTAWLQAAKPAMIKIVGEKANHAAWVMVYPAPDVLSYLRGKNGNDSYFTLTITPNGLTCQATFSGCSFWNNKYLAYSFVGRKLDSVLLSSVNGQSTATFSLPLDLRKAFALSIESEEIAAIDTLFGFFSKSEIYPKKLITLKSRRDSLQRWILEGESHYTPELGTSLSALSALRSSSGQQHLMISTHQDIAWMDSPQQCEIDRDEKIISPLLEILKNDTTYHFDLEDVLCLREYVERHPDRKNELHQFMKEGRLGIGASYTQPYEELCSGEMLVRQFYFGRKWLKNNFPDVDGWVYWNPDVPGRTLQMPQIMQKAGVPFLLVSRHEMGLYNWRSPDGSEVLTYTPGHYGDFRLKTYGMNLQQMEGYIASNAIEWNKKTPGGVNHFPLLSSVDMSGPDRFDELIQEWSNLKSIKQSNGVKLQPSLPPLMYSSAEKFFSSILAKKPNLTIIEGERPNIWLYIHGPTHHWAISAKREADMLLPAAEIFSTVDAMLKRSFQEYPTKAITKAWEAQIYPDHGWGGKNGEITDSTFKAKYEFARNAGKEILSQALNSIASSVKTNRSKGIHVLLFNSLSWKRSSPVQFQAQFKKGEISKGIEMFDAAGTRVDNQIVNAERYPDGSIRKCEVVFIAVNLPSVGYSTYYVQPSGELVRTAKLKGATANILESKFYSVSLGHGGVKQIYDKELGREILKSDKFLGGELFTMQSIGEDAGEWAEPQHPTMEGFDKLSNHKPTWSVIEDGPVRVIAEMKQQIEHATVVQRILLYKAVKQIDFETSLLDWDGTKYREFRLAFPINVQDGQVSYEVPFGVVEVGKSEMKGAAGERYTIEASKIHPRGIQNWIGVSGQEFGVTFSSSVAVWDYLDPTEPAAQRQLLQPILLASRRSCHGAGNWYLQAGDHHYRFSLTSHIPGWEHGERFGVEANTPLITLINPIQDLNAMLPEQQSFLSIDQQNIVLSTMKKSEDDQRVLLRLYDTRGVDREVTLQFMSPIRSAELTNIIEEDGRSIPADKRAVQLTVGHHAIETMKLKLQ
ncbi:MAG: glycoside hydrolase family 38 C-terminal domain-containing protein [bacterium]